MPLTAILSGRWAWMEKMHEWTDRQTDRQTDIRVIIEPKTSVHTCVHAQCTHAPTYSRRSNTAMDHFIAACAHSLPLVLRSTVVRIYSTPTFP